MGARERGACLALALLAGCALRPYEAWRVELPPTVPADAFERCRAVVRSFGALTVEDPRPLRLQTAWTRGTVGDSLVDRRTTVFGDGGDLAIICEVRYWDLGGMTWLPSRGEPRRERELGELLLAALR